MDSINWTAMLVAAGFGTVIAGLFWAAGTWLDRRQVRRWDAELNDPNPPQDIVVPIQRDGSHDADGA